MSSKKFVVPAIGCQGCVNTIQNEVKAIDGVTSVKGDMNSKEVVVEWDAPATWEQIKDILVEIEYPPAE